MPTLPKSPAPLSGSVKSNVRLPSTEAKAETKKSEAKQTPQGVTSERESSVTTTTTDVATPLPTPGAQFEKTPGQRSAFQSNTSPGMTSSDGETIACDPLSLSALKGAIAESPVMGFATKLMALADGIDAGMVHGNRLTTILGQIPKLSFGDFDRLWGKETAGAFSGARDAYLEALHALAQTAPDLAIPPIGMSALESLRMNQIHAALLRGDDDDAKELGTDAAALFPDSDLFSWYQSLHQSRSFVVDVTSTNKDTLTAPLVAAQEVFEKLHGDLVDNKIDLDAVQAAVSSLEELPNFDDDNVRTGARGALKADFENSLKALAEIAPDVVIFGDQTLAEASLYGQVLAAQADGGGKALRDLAAEFLSTFPKSERAAWIEALVLD